MSNRNDNKKRTTRKRNDIIANRLFILTALTVASVSFVVYAKSNVAFNTALHTGIGLTVFAYAALAAAIGFFAYGIIAGKKSDAQKAVIMSRGFTSGVLAALSLAAFFYLAVSSETKLIIIMIAALALCFIYYLYKLEFFYLSALTAATILLIDLRAVFNYESGGFLNRMITIGSLAISILLAVIVFGALVAMRSGKKSFLGIRLSDDGFRYYTFIITALLLLAGSLLGFFIGSLITYILITVMIVYLVFAIIYTIDMTA